MLDPTNFVLDPTNFVLDPSDFVLDPSDFVLGPSDFVLDPSGSVLDPTNFVLGPSNFVLGPSNFVLDPSGFVLGRSNFVLDRSRFALDPSGFSDRALDSGPASCHAAGAVANLAPKHSRALLDRVPDFDGLLWGRSWSRLTTAVACNPTNGHESGDKRQTIFLVAQPVTN